jgi:starch phosphorylase
MAAGFDRFSPALIGQYLRRYAEDGLGIALQGLLALGRLHADDASEPFNPVAIVPLKAAQIVWQR